MTDHYAKGTNHLDQAVGLMQAEVAPDEVIATALVAIGHLLAALVELQTPADDGWGP